MAQFQTLPPEEQLSPSTSKNGNLIQNSPAAVEELVEESFHVIEDIYDNFERDEEINDALIHNLPVDGNTNSNQSKRKSTSALSQILELEKKKMKFCQDHLEDADWQFLLSLAPRLKEMSKKNKVLAKIEIQQVLLKYAD